MRSDTHPISAGAAIKKVVDINPELKVQDVLEIIKRSIDKETGQINDAVAVELAKSSLAAPQYN
jgi:hypothetical protein